MAITTDNGKLAIMELDQDYEPGLPLSPGAFGQDDQQQLLWGFPEILWTAAVVPSTTGQVFYMSAFNSKLVVVTAFNSKIVELDATNDAGISR